jgi:dUTP pyrophosphatase
MMINLKVKRLTDTAKLPTYAHDGDACFDIYSDGVIEESFDVCTMVETELHSTGLQFDIPVGYAMMIYSRSGQGFKFGGRLANCVGVIDSGYRGEIKVKITFDEQNGGFNKKGDRIAQAMLIPVPVVTFEEVAELSDSERGEGGFGSSGR